MGGGGSQLCQDPVNGRGVPSCALTPGTPVMAHGSLAVLVSPPPPKMLEEGGTTPTCCPLPWWGGGHTISTAPLCLGRVMGHRASPPPGTSPIQEGTELCWGHRVGSDTPPPPPGVGLGACAPPKGYPHSFPPSCSESGCAEKCVGGTCVPSMPPPPPPGEVARGHVGVWPPPHPRPSLLPRGRVCTSSARR